MLNGKALLKKEERVLFIPFSMEENPRTVWGWE